LYVIISTIATLVPGAAQAADRCVMVEEFVVCKSSVNLTQSKGTYLNSIAKPRRFNPTTLPLGPQKEHHLFTSILPDQNNQSSPRAAATSVQDQVHYNESRQRKSTSTPEPQLMYISTTRTRLERRHQQTEPHQHYASPAIAFQKPCAVQLLDVNAANMC
jgi:NADH dehydrogenase/NADH:ubiquinone oxidoreductase subunit G